MASRSARKIWWSITALYTLFIYATLGMAPSIWSRLNSFLGGRGLLAQYTIYFVIGFLVLLYILFVKREKSIARYLLFFLFAGLFFLMIKFERNPGEKIHIAEYGLLGILLYNALKIDFDRFDNRFYLLGSLICVIIGAIDEVVQGTLPNRYFTWHDVFINGASGIIALLIIRFNILRRI